MSLGPRVSGTALAAACVLACAGIDPALAATSGRPEAAFWWQPEPISGLIPVPGVPSNGMYLASSPTGPQAVAAVRFPVSTPTGFVRLTLHVSMQERVGRPSVIAYPATSRWQTGGPQTWSARPSYRAGGRATRGVFTHNGSRMVLTFPAHLAATGLVLLPDPNASNKTFTIAFHPPQATDVSLRRSGHSPSPSPSTRPPSHRPGPTPPASQHPTHSSRPSAHPTHPDKSRKPPSHRPTKRPSRPPSPSTSPTPAASPPVVAQPDSPGNGTTIGLAIGGVVLAGAVGGGIVAARRRRS